MPGQINTYIEGLDRDTSYQNFSNKRYFNLENFKVTTEEGLSTGSLETQKGNTLAFKVQDVAPSYIIDNVSFPISTDITIDGTTESITAEDSNQFISEIEDKFSSFLPDNFKVLFSKGNIYFIGLDSLSFSVSASNLNVKEFYPGRSDLKICGWGELRDSLILFTTDSRDSEPDSYGQIWKIDYDYINDTFKDLDLDNFLVPSKHLVNNSKLNFSLAYKIDEVIGRYENQDIARVYWTDNYNPLRTINVFRSDSYIVSPVSMSIISDVQFAQPKIESIGSGDLPVGSVVQYCYRLRNRDEGAETVFSPLSPPIKLSASDGTSDSYQDYGGSFKGDAESRSVTFSINGIDTSFSSIEVFVIIHESKDDPRIYRISQENVPQGGSTTITNSHIPADGIEIPYSEFNKIRSSFDRCKSITTKDNRLIAANVGTSDFDPDFDARAYRFNSDQKAWLFNKSADFDNKDLKESDAEHVIDGSGINWNNISIPDDADAINAYNYDPQLWDDLTSGNRHDFTEHNDCKYKSDGKTYGGEGPNISYEFVVQDLIGDETDDVDDTPLIDVKKNNPNNFPVYLDNLNFGVEDPQGNSVTHDLSGEYHNQKGYRVDSYLTGYMNGEIYRFGIVLYDISGSPSFVKWIGDIRFPFTHETESAKGGPSFEFNDLQQPVIGLNGDSENKLQRSLGINFTVDISSIKEQISGFEIVRLPREQKDMSRFEEGLLLDTWRYDKKYLYDPYEDIKNFLDHYTSAPPPYANLVTNYTLSTAFDDDDTAEEIDYFPCIYSGVIGQFKELDDIVDEIEYIETDALVNCEGKDQEIHSDSGPPTTKTIITRVPNPSKDTYPKVDRSNARVRFDVRNKEILEVSDFANTDLAQFSNTIYEEEIFVNAFYLGPITVNGGEAFPEAGRGDRKLVLYPFGDSSINDFYPRQDSTIRRPYVILGKNRTIEMKQYGGDSFFERSNQRYISTGHYQPITEDTSDIFNTYVFGGDVYNFYYDSQICVNSKKDLSGIGGDNERRTQGVFHAIQSTVNTELRDKSDNIFNNLAKEGRVDPSGKNRVDLVSNFSYNETYLQRNNVRRIFRSKDIFANPQEEHSHMIWASDNKIDGERTDSWRFFRPAHNINIEGIYGPVNKVINFKDIIYFLQDRAFGAVSLNERATTVSEQGATLTLGYGGILDDYRYVSTVSGSKHNSSVIQSGSSIYYVDALNKKILRFSQNGNTPLSDINGMFTYTKDTIVGDVETNEDSLREGAGIHSVFDAKNNRVFFTFNDFFLDPNFNIVDTSSTLSYSENLGAFEGFFSHVPPMYIQKDHRIFSLDPENKDHVYQHEKGNPGEFYGTTYPSKVTVIVNKDFPHPKIFNNIEFSSYSSSGGDDIHDDTIDLIRAYNNYQDSGEVPLTSNENIKRRFRKWRLPIPRNNDPSSNSYDPNAKDDARIRDLFAFLEFIYNNDDGNRFLLHNIETYYKPKPK